MIAALISFGTYTAQDQLAIYLAWASVIGSGFQFFVQLPRVLQYLPHFRPVIDTSSEHVRTVIKNFGPIFLSRGVVQISALIDSVIASLIPTTGAVAALGYGQIISVLPVSLFSMSVSAAEFPLCPAQSEPMTRWPPSSGRLHAGLRTNCFLCRPFRSRVFDSW